MREEIVYLSISGLKAFGFLSFESFVQNSAEVEKVCCKTPNCSVWFPSDVCPPSPGHYTVGDTNITQMCFPSKRRKYHVHFFTQMQTVRNPFLTRRN